MEDALLAVSNLTVEFQLRRGSLTAVDNVSFKVREREALGIVGETGCGKSVTALSILGLLPTPPARATGNVEFEGENLLQNSERKMCNIRGRKIGMVFQEPLTSLNPAFSIGEQVAECFRVHLGHSKKVAYYYAAHILDRVRVPSPKTLMKLYPHELSGGMRQRVMIAMALACKPKLLIADEPTTALDVTIQAQILELLEELRDEMKLAIIFISHNLGVVARVCHRIAVMYAGSLVELSDTKGVFSGPLHPYTIGLLNAMPRPEFRDTYLRAIPGNVCDLIKPPAGCKFHPRCFKAQQICAQERPRLQAQADRHDTACFFPGES
jgi:peptide/nickel transport system ATP-binding protein/oligopeptide transport system ATP-binding protein